MKAFALVLVALLACIYVANGLILDAGYILIAYDDFSFETSLWMGGVLIIALYLSLWLLKLSLRAVLASLNLIVPVTAEARTRRAQRYSTQGLSQLISGNWRRAHRLLSKAAEQGDHPLVDYIGAARAAHELGKHDLSNEYLRLADSKVSGAQLAIGLTQAELMLKAGENEQALASLQSLHSKRPKHVFVLKCLAKVYKRLQDWQQLASLLPKLRKHEVFSEEKLEALERNIYAQLFAQAYKQATLEESPADRAHCLDKLWDGLSRAQQKNPQMVKAHAENLLNLELWVRAEKLLRNELKRRYQADLVGLYGRLKHVDGEAQLKFLRSLLEEHPKNARILLALGHASINAGLNALAKDYFIESLELQSGAEACHELAELFESEGEHEQSCHYYRQARQISTHE